MVWGDRIGWVTGSARNYVTWNSNADIMSQAYTAYTRKPPQTLKAPGEQTSNVLTHQDVSCSRFLFLLSPQ